MCFVCLENREGAGRSGNLKAQYRLHHKNVSQNSKIHLGSWNSSKSCSEVIVSHRKRSKLKLKLKTNNEISVFFSSSGQVKVPQFHL